MKGWIKYFADGSSIVGLDKAVNQKMISWTKSRMEDLIRVEAHHDLNSISISGTGNFHQSDDFIVRQYSNNSRCIKRRIQKQVGGTDKSVILNYKNNRLEAQFYDVKKEKKYDGEDIKIRSMDLSKEEGKWLTLEIDTFTGAILVSLQDKKI